MANEKIIPLYNRYYKGIYLENVDGNKFKLSIPDSASSYMRISYMEKADGSVDTESFFFIDPDGGPFLSVGSDISGYRISRIYEEKVNNKSVFMLDMNKKGE